MEEQKNPQRVIEGDFLFDWHFFIASDKFNL